MTDEKPQETLDPESKPAPPPPIDPPTGGQGTAPVQCPLCGRRGRRHYDQGGLPYCGYCGMFRVP